MVGNRQVPDRVACGGCVRDFGNEKVDILASVRGRVSEHFRFTKDLLGGCLEKGLVARGQETVWEEATGGSCADGKGEGTPEPGGGS